MSHSQIMINKMYKLKRIRLSNGKKAKYNFGAKCSSYQMVTIVWIMTCMFINGRNMVMLAGLLSLESKRFQRSHVYFGILIGFGKSILIINGLSIKLILVLRAAKSDTKYQCNTKELKNLLQDGMVSFK